MPQDKMKQAAKLIKNMSDNQKSALLAWLDNIDKIACILIIDQKAVKLYFNNRTDAENFIVAAEKAANTTVVFIQEK